MAYERIIYGATISGSLIVTGSVEVTDSITASLFGTSSYATNALTSSFSQTASFVNPLNQNVLITGSLRTTGSIVLTGSLDTRGDVYFIQNQSGTVYVNTTTFSGASGWTYWSRAGGGNGLGIANGSGVVFAAPNFGKPQMALGLNITGGGLDVVGGITGSLTGSMTGSLFGTASYALTASYAANSELPNGVVSSSAQLSNGGGTSFSGTDNVTFGQVTASAVLVTNLYVQNVTSSTELVTGSLTVSGSLNALGGVTGSLFGTSSYAVQALSSSFALTASYVNPLNQNLIITGSVFVSSSVVVPTISASYINLGTPGSGINPYITFSGSASGSIRLEVLADGSVAFIGSNGVLLGVADSLSGSLFAVNDISGFPILEVFSDDRVVMGKYGAPAITVSGSFASITGSLLGTSSYAMTASYALSASGTSGSSGSSGTSGSSGSSGTSGSSGSSGTSGTDGSSGSSGTSGSSGSSGTSGTDGSSGTSGSSGSSGTSGSSGSSGTSGTNGSSGSSGTSGSSGSSGTSGSSGSSGTSGTNGSSGSSGTSGSSGSSGTSGSSGSSGTSGLSGSSGTSGSSGSSGTSGSSGSSGTSGSSGSSGTSGTNGSSGSSGTSGSSGSSGTSGSSGSSGTSGTNGSSGSSGTSGSSGSSGTSGSSGSSGTSGTNGSSGSSGTSGSSGSSGTSGSSGSSGTSGSSGSSGTSGTNGSSGTSGSSGSSGTSGSSGSSGTSGTNGSSGSSGTSGSSGSSGTSGSSGSSGTSGVGTITGGTANYAAIFSNSTTLTTGSIFNSGSNVIITGSVYLTGSLFYSYPNYVSGSTHVLTLDTSSGEVYYNYAENLFSTPTVLTVGPTGSTGVDFFSIKAAVDSITDASANKPYTVSVRGGLYIEDPITMKSYVSVVGQNSTTTIIQARDSGSTLINGADQSMIQDVQIQGCTITGTAAVQYSSATTPQTNAIFYVENVRFGTNYTHARTVGTGGGNCIMQCSNVKYGGYSFTIGFHVTNDGSGIGRMQLRNVTSTNGGITTTSGLVFAKADKPGCTFIVNGCLLTKSVGAAAGTGFLAYDGASLRLTAVNFQRWDKAIYLPQSGSAPSIFGSALNFENDTLDVVVEHTGSTGKLEGPDTFLKNQIVFTSSLYIVNKDQRRIKVAKKGGDFTSIKSAVDWITDSTETNRYVVEVGPGAFYEQEISLVGKPYVSIVGSNIQTTEIFPAGSNQNIINIGVNNELSFLSLTNAPVGYAAIVADDIGDFAQVHKVSFYGCDTNIKIIARTQDTQFYGEYIDFNGTYSYGTYVSGSNGFYALVNLENYYQFPSGSANLIANEAIGTAELDLRACVFQGEGVVNGSVGLRLSAGANTEGTSLDIQGFDTGIQILNFENSSSFDIVGSMIHDSTTLDFDILHPNAVCRYQGSADHSMINNQSNNFYWSFLDVTDGEYDITEKLSVTFSDGTHTDATTLIFKGSPMGIMEGGLITTGSGLQINASGGFGYVEDITTPSVYKRYDWTNNTLNLSANSNNYIYISNSGVLSAASSVPDNVNNIILGRAVTNNSGIEFIDQSPYRGTHTATQLAEFARVALGPVYSQGSIVTENAAPFKLDVTSGTYFFGENQFNPAGTSSLTYTQYFRSASAWDRSFQTIVTTNTFDSGSDVLAPLSSSAYTKHTLYAVGQGVDEEYFLVIGQTQYASLVEAEGATLPTPPSYFNDGVVNIASIIVQSGSSNIVSIQDIRPVIGFKASGVTATATHGNLLGLSNDDHPQYLLTDGTRTLTGNMNVGGYNISNANSITSTSFTGSLQGTSSWSNNTVTASFIAQSGYLYALSTSSQVVASANTWQELNYERNQDISNWTHTVGTGRFTSSLSATYNIRMITSIQKNSGANQTGATRFLYNGIEVTGSYSSYTMVSNNVPQEIISEATLFIESGSGIRTQVAGTSNTVTVIPGVSVASPVVRPSAKIFISKV